MRRVRPAAPITVALLAALAAVGCQPPQSAMPPEAVQAAPTGTVSIDLAAIRAAWGPKRKAQVIEQPYQVEPDDPETFEVTQLRLTVKGPGITQALVTTIPFLDEEKTSGTASAPIASFSLAVPAGLNRYFRLEALNSNGRIIHTARSLAGITAGQTLSIRFSAASDAAARTLESLMGPVPANQTDTAGVRTKLATEDFTAALLSYVTAATGFDAGSNLYGDFSPHAFRSETLAAKLRTDGKAFLTATPSPSEQTLFAVSSYINVKVLGAPWDWESVIVSFCAHDTLHDNDPIVDQGNGDLNYGFNYAMIPPGSYSVRAKHTDGREAWGTMTIGEGLNGETGTETLTLTLPPVSSPSPSPTVSPTASPNPTPTPTVTPSSSPSPSPSPASDPRIYTDSHFWEDRTNFLGYTGGGSLIEDTSDPYSGTKALRFSVGNGNALYLHDDFVRTDETLYDTLQFWAKADMSAQSYMIALADVNGNVLGTPQPFSPDISYTFHSFSTAGFETDLSQVSTIKIYFAGQGTPTLLIDELTFANVAP